MCNIFFKNRFEWGGRGYQKLKNEVSLTNWNVSCVFVTCRLSKTPQFSSTGLPPSRPLPQRPEHASFSRKLYTPSISQTFTLPKIVAANDLSRSGNRWLHVFLVYWVIGYCFDLWWWRVKLQAKLLIECMHHHQFWTLPTNFKKGRFHGHMLGKYQRYGQLCCFLTVHARKRNLEVLQLELVSLRKAMFCVSRSAVVESCADSSFCTLLKSCTNISLWLWVFHIRWGFQLPMSPTK